MYKAICAFIFLCLLTVSTDAAYAQSYYEKQFSPFLTRGGTTWSISLGARQNEIEWNISDTDGVPNIDHEQTWTDVRTLDLQGKVRHVEPVDIAFVKGGVHLEAGLTGGLTMDGRSRLSNYAGNNRTLEFIRQSFSSLDGDTLGANVSVGYKIFLTGTPGWKTQRILQNRTPRTGRERALRARALQRSVDREGPVISLTPLIGYTIDQHTYHREDAFNHFAVPGLGVGSFRTESDYIANWYGPVFGLEGEFSTKKHMIRLRGEYHDLEYYGKEIRYSREDLQQDPSMDHEADGNGLLLAAEYAYALGEDYALTFDTSYKEREAEDGIYTVYPVNGQSTSQPFNEVKESSQAVHIGLRYNWN